MMFKEGANTGLSIGILAVNKAFNINISIYTTPAA
jgi:hypothetical protein